MIYDEDEEMYRESLEYVQSNKKKSAFGNEGILLNRLGPVVWEYEDVSLFGAIGINVGTQLWFVINPQIYPLFDNYEVSCVYVEEFKYSKITGLYTVYPHPNGWAFKNHLDAIAYAYYLNVIALRKVKKELSAELRTMRKWFRSKEEKAIIKSYKISIKKMERKRSNWKKQLGLRKKI